MAFELYPSFRESALKGEVDCINDPWKVALLSSAHVDDAAHVLFADVSADEVSGTGYTAGGITCPDRTVVNNSGRAEVRVASDPTFSGITVTNAQVAVIYSDGVTKYLVGRHVESTAQSPSGVDLPVNFTDANNAVFDFGPAV